MSRAKVFYDLLVDAASSEVGGRITPFPLPVNQSLPAIIYRQVYGAHSTRTSGDASLYHARWQVDILSETFAGAAEIAEVITDYFDSKQDSTSNPKVYDTHVDMSFPVSDLDLDAYRHIVDVTVISD